MSECPGFTLEAYVVDDMRLVVNDDVLYDSFKATFYANQLVIPVEEFKRALAVYEPAREKIENRLQDFDEERHGSFRSYRCAAINDCYVTPEMEAQLDELRQEWLDKFPLTKGVVK